MALWTGTYVLNAHYMRPAARVDRCENKGDASYIREQSASVKKIDQCARSLDDTRRNLMLFREKFVPLHANLALTKRVKPHA